MTKAEQPTITQDDWDMAIAFGNAVGGVDTSLLAEYFRRHRTTSLAAQDGLVERVARALCELHIRNVRRHDTELPKLEAMLDGAVDYSWRDFEPQAKAALSAIKGDKS